MHTDKTKNEISHIENVLWRWADEFNLPDEVFPRQSDKLWALTELEIVNQGLITKVNDISELEEVISGEKKPFYLPPEFFELINLTKLEIFGMMMNYLPDEIGKLTNLTEFTFVMNNLGILPSSVGDLKNLTHLDVGCNGLEEIPITLALLKKLKYLDISSTRMIIDGSQEDWLYRLQNSGCEVIWDEENTKVQRFDEDYEAQDIHDFIEAMGGEDAVEVLLNNYFKITNT